MTAKDKKDPQSSAEEAVFLEMFYQKYSDRLFNYAYGFLKSKHETEEAVQDIFVIFWKNKHSIHEKGAYESYLFRIAKHHLLNLLRKKAREDVVSYEPNEHVQLQWSVEKSFIYHEQLDTAALIIEKLPPRRKEVYELKKSDQLTNKQIAQKLQISTTMVEKHWRNAMISIKGQLGLIEK